MNKKLTLGIVILVAIVLIVFGMMFVRNMYAPIDLHSDGECSVTIDCVAATCCHPDSCIPRAQAPDCEGTFCTQECAPDTMDCGQGSCQCINGVCEAVIN